MGEPVTEGRRPADGCVTDRSRVPPEEAAMTCTPMKGQHRHDRPPPPTPSTHRGRDPFLRHCARPVGRGRRLPVADRHPSTPAADRGGVRSRHARLRRAVARLQGEAR